MLSVVFLSIRGLISNKQSALVSTPGYIQHIKGCNHALYHRDNFRFASGQRSTGVRGLSDHIQAIESTKRAQDERIGLQDERIGHLTKEISALRSQVDGAKTIEAVEKTN